MAIILYLSNISLCHDTGHGHPECAARIAVLQKLIETPPFLSLPRGTIKPATENQLLLAHPLSYIDRIRDSIPDRGLVQIDGDTILSPQSWDAAMDAAGAACAGVDDIANGKTTRAFVAARPPGHHAESNTAMGFCLFNNVFIAARHAQTAHGYKKVAIVDFDVHHGNGTDTMARRHDGTILYISTHQSPLFPMTGDPQDNEECVLNFTLPAHSGSFEMRALYEGSVFPALESFAPDFLIISAGFDAHKNDPLAQLNWESADYGWLTEKLCAVANKHCDGRILSVLEGGYDLDALSESVAVHLQALA